MKNFSSNKYNNKGVAMISVMIAIAFISIIATAMIYTSSTNYAMKSANIRAKENFYETDGELVKVSSSIRNNAMSGSNPGSYVDTLKRSTGDTSKYDCTKIVKAAYPTATVSGGVSDATITKDGDTIHFKGNGTILKQTKSDDATIIDNVTRYTLKDFEVVQTNSAGFRNSVKTDVVFDIYETSVPSGGSGGVGNMSLLLDSNISASDTTFPSLTMTGNSFVTDYGTSTTSWGGGTYTVPGTNGINMTSESRINFAGDYNVVYGDVHLSGSSSLCVYGDLTVYGDIYIDGNATLIMAGNGKIHLVDAVLPGRSSKPTIHLGTGCSSAHNLYPSDLFIDDAHNQIDYITEDAFKSFCSQLRLNDSDLTNDGLMKKIMKKVNIAGSNQYVTEITGVNINGITGDGASLKTDYMGRNIGYFMLKPGYSGNLNGGLDNYLYFSSTNETVTMTQNNVNTTYICRKPLNFGVEHGVVLTKLGTAEFNYITAAKGDAESAVYNTTDNPFNDVTINFSSGSYTGKIGDFFEADCNTYVDEMFNISTGGSSSGSKKYASTIYFKSYDRDND